MENSILDLSPEEFESAIAELGFTPEDEEFLREEYKSANSVSGRVEEAFKPEEGRERSAFLPMTKPEGISTMDALMSGQGQFALPGVITEGIQEAIEGVEAPAWAGSGLEGQGTLEDAWKTVGIAAGGSATATVPEGSVRMFGGNAARNFPREAEDRAIEMYWRPDSKDPNKAWGDNPLNADLIWEETGIELKNGTRAIFQIDPSNAQVADPPTIKAALDSFWEKYPDYKDAVYPVEEILDFPELYDNYPQLKEFSVVFDKRLGEGNYGYMNISDQELGINPKLLEKPEELRATLLHEMQHGIQAKEFSEGGATPNYFFRINVSDPEQGANWYDRVTASTEDLKSLEREINDRIEWAEINWDKLSDDQANQVVEEIYRLKLSGVETAYKKYLTNEGEIEARAAELWDNLSTEEKRTTRPSQVMNQALGLLKKEYGDTHMPTARLAFAEGGVVEGTNMENNMTKLFAEGGVNTGRTEVDPVSGNEVPPGSLPEEVRDDVDAKLSGGEYVVPADVLRYYGVSFFEKLRKKAKEGLSEMDKEGRIGGEVEEDDLPFSDEELMVADEEDDMEFAQGGAVPFNPNSQMYGGQTLPVNSPIPLNPNPTGQTPSNPFTTPTNTFGSSSGGMETRTYENAQGQKMQILFINGQPGAPIPTGFFPEGTVPKQTTPTATTKPDKEGPKGGGAEERRNLGQTGREQGGNSGTGRTWDPGVDFSNSQAVSDYVSKELNQANTYGKVGGGLAQLALGPIGGLVGGVAAAGTQVSNARAASIIARAQGNTELADKLDKEIDDYVESKGLVGKAALNALATGELKAKRYLEAQRTGVTASGTTPPSMAGKSGGSAGGKTFTKDGDKSGGTGPKKGAISGPTGGSSQKKGSSPSTTGKTSSKPAPSKSTPSKSTGGQKASDRSDGRFGSGGLVERRKK